MNPVDQSGAVDGKIVISLGAGPGVYEWCETQAPTGFALADPACGSFTAYYEVDTAWLLKHKRLAVLGPS